MRLGINLIYLVPGQTGGMEVYARELLPALARAAPGIEMTAFLSVEAADAGLAWPGVACRRVPVHARSRTQWVLGEQLLLAPLAARHGIELLHSLASTAPAWGRAPRVTTVHDLIYARFPETHGGLRALGMRALVPLAVRRSERVIAISQSTKRDLQALLGTPQEKIDVVPQGLGSTASTAALGAADVRARLALGERPVVLSLSAKRPHKNLLVLLDALAAIPRDRRPVLVLPGYPTAHERELRARAAALGIEQDVRLVGWIDGEELEGLWTVSSAFVFPSLYEGFGLPVLEAMARGVPVACSNASSLPEVAGEAALLFDPHSAEQIASSIQRLVEDAGEAQRLRAAGRERARRFTWERTAELTLASYARALGLDAVPDAWRDRAAPAWRDGAAPA